MESTWPAVVADLKDVADVVAGGMHTLCLTADGKVWSFGCNDDGALGRRTSSLDGSETTPGTVEIPEMVTRVTAGDSHSAALTVSGKVYLWGNFRYSRGQMGLITPGKAEPEPKLVISNIAQDKFNVKFKVRQPTVTPLDGRLHSWGFGTNGQLGHGGDDDLFEPKVVAGKFAGKKTLVVSGGGQHAVILAT
ncbi:hypothetical protein HPB50_029124 [Hyalomma asiaticum]|nr:hypothetical protein HPB50_029124 [Hyalomma asiaticum]